MTSLSVVESTPPRLTTRRQCTRAGVVTKYYRRNSGEVEPSPFYSTWFREEIIADQRFERRRRQILSRRTWNRFSEMDVDADRHNTTPPVLRGKRQADCKICKTELTDWTNVTSPGSCCHLFHALCYQFWWKKHQPSSSSSSSARDQTSSECPVCMKTRREETKEVAVAVPVVQDYTIPLVLRGSKLLSETVDETQDALGNITISKSDNGTRSEGKEDSTDVKNVTPLLES